MNFNLINFITLLPLYGKLPTVLKKINKLINGITPRVSSPGYFLKMHVKNNFFHVHNILLVLMLVIITEYFL
jgi:hypothetical protein